MITRVKHWCPKCKKSTIFILLQKKTFLDWFLFFGTKGASEMVRGQKWKCTECGTIMEERLNNGK